MADNQDAPVIDLHGILVRQEERIHVERVACWINTPGLQSNTDDVDCLAKEIEDIESLLALVKDYQDEAAANFSYNYET